MLFLGSYWSLPLTLHLWMASMDRTAHATAVNLSTPSLSLNTSLHQLFRSPQSSFAVPSIQEPNDNYCPIYRYPSDSLNEDEDLQNSPLSTSQVQNTELHKRTISSPRRYDRIGRCQLPYNQFVKAPDFSGLADLRQRGRYPGGWHGMNGYAYNGVPKWYVAERHCDSYGWYKTERSGPEDIPAGSLQSVDHVCKLICLEHKIFDNRLTA